MLNIQPSKYYYLQEVVDEKFIPGIKGYAGLYNLVTQKVAYKENTENTDFHVKRELAPATTTKSIKAEHDGKPWHEINGKIKVRGAEIIRFLKLNGMLDPNKL